MTAKTTTVIDETPPPSEADVKKVDDMIMARTKINPELPALLWADGSDSVTKESK